MVGSKKKESLPGLAPVRPIGPAYNQVADQLMEAILSGALRPGNRLPIEADLAASFDVSRSTIREAIRSLSSHGVLVTLRGGSGGTFVSEPDGDDIAKYLKTALSLYGSDSLSVDVFLEAREMLEVKAVELAIERCSPELIERLEACLASPEDFDTHDRFSGNLQFHIELATGSQNPLIEAISRPLFTILRTRFLRDDAPTSFWNGVDRDHRAITSAIRNGDATSASNLMKAHLAAMRDTYVEIDQFGSAR